MAIVKIIAHGKSNDAMRGVIDYVLNPKKTRDDLCSVSGDYLPEKITSKKVYQDFRRVKKMFHKDQKGNRTYLHGTISFAPGEIQEEQVAAFAKDFIDKIYPGYQVLTAVHTDTDHLHAHFIVNTVSYEDGTMLHTSKKDLERAKQICNAMCKERTLSIAQKGFHADGSKFAPGEITAWNKNKYHQMAEDPKHSYLIDLALAIQTALPYARSKEEFCTMMEQDYRWKVIWTDTKKNITFIDDTGKRVRASNISKTFNLEITKEALELEFKRNRERRETTHSTESARGNQREGEYNSGVEERERGTKSASVGAREGNRRLYEQKQEPTSQYTSAKKSDTRDADQGR